MSSLDVTILIVNYNTKDMLRDCITSLREQVKGLTYQVVVVDNDSKDGSVAMVAAEFPDVDLVDSKVNHGFAKGNNIGMQQAQGEFLFYLNPDTVLLNDAVSLLRAYLKNNPNAGIVGPRLYMDAAGKHHPSIRKFTTTNNILFRYTPGYRFFQAFYESRLVKKDKVQRVDWLMGAALMGRASLLRELGGFDEKFFVYSEEEDLCRRLLGKGLHVHYVPEAKVVHLGGGSSRQAPRLANKFFWDSQMAYLNRYFSPATVRTFVRRFSLLLTVKAFVASGDKRLYFEQIKGIVRENCP